MNTDWRSLRTLSASGDPPSWTQSKTANLAAATCSAHFPRLSAFSTISTEKNNFNQIIFYWAYIVKFVKLISRKKCKKDDYFLNHFLSIYL